MPARHSPSHLRPATRRGSRPLERVPLEGAPRRGSRLLRGGPRAPLPLVLLIAAAAGVAVAYVSQTARATQATYRATTMLDEQAALKREDVRVGDELARLRSTSRIVAAAQQMGMRPAGQWVYLAETPTSVVPPPTRLVDSDAPAGGSLHRLAEALSGVFGPAGPADGGGGP